MKRKIKVGDIVRLNERGAERYNASGLGIVTVADHPRSTYSGTALVQFFDGASNDNPIDPITQPTPGWWVPYHTIIHVETPDETED